MKNLQLCKQGCCYFWRENFKNLLRHYPNIWLLPCLRISNLIPKINVELEVVYFLLIWKLSTALVQWNGYITSITIIRLLLLHLRYSIRTSSYFNKLLRFPFFHILNVILFLWIVFVLSNYSLSIAFIVHRNLIFFQRSWCSKNPAWTKGNGCWKLIFL